MACHIVTGIARSLNCACVFHCTAEKCTTCFHLFSLQILMYWSLGLVLLLSSVVASRGPEDLTADIFIQKLSRWTKKTAAWTEDLTLFSFG